MKILNTILTLGCLGGLVSCYPVAGQNTTGPNLSKKKTVSVKTPATTTTKKKVSSTVKKTTSTTPSADASDTTSTTVGDTVKKLTPPKIEVPKAVKNATKVPGKEGFVFNPYTHNQVDVRGIPSGTKVRDPHDANPAHVFRVP